MKDNVKSVLSMITVWVLAGLLAFSFAYFFVGPYVTSASAVTLVCETDSASMNKPMPHQFICLEGTESLTNTVEVDKVEPKLVARVDLPIGWDVQDYVFDLCEQYNLNPKIVFAIIQKESRCTPNAKGDSGRSLGLMQIQPKWHKERMNRLGCTDLLNPYQNVRVGIDILVELYRGGRSNEWVLMAYNGGPGYANKKAAAGEVSDYARSVLKIARGLEVTYETQ